MLYLSSFFESLLEGPFLSEAFTDHLSEDSKTPILSTHLDFSVAFIIM